MPITSQTIFERADYQIGVASQDISTADVTGTYFSMKGFNRVGAVLITDTLASGDAVTVQLFQATDSAGAGSKALGSAVTFTADADEAGIAEVEAQAFDMDINNDFEFVAAVVTATPAGATTINGAVTFIRADGSYRP